jgi:hypothetical protein
MLLSSKVWMLSYFFGGLGSLVAPRPDICHEFQVRSYLILIHSIFTSPSSQLHMKSSNFSEALKLLKLPDHGININEIVYDEFYPIHLACAAGELVKPSAD